MGELKAEWYRDHQLKRYSTCSQALSERSRGLAYIGSALARPEGSLVDTSKISQLVMNKPRTLCLV